MNRSAVGILGLTPLVLLGACQTMQPKLGFDEVQSAVSERSGMRVEWTSGSVEDAAVAEAVAALLDQELTADAAVQIALLNNRELRAVYEDLNLAQADLVRAGLLRNPVFGGEVRFATNGGGTGVALDLSYEFLTLLSMPLRKAAAQAAFEGAKLRVTGAVLDLAAEVRSGFYRLQSTQQSVEMRSAVVAATEASFELARRLREAGNIRELDVSMEQALHEQAKLDLAAAEAAVESQRENLNELMGVWGPAAAWKIGPRLPALPDEELASEDLERRAVERSLDLAITRRDIEVASRTLGLARPFGVLEGAEVGVVAEREVEGGWSVGPSLAVPIPLFDQGQAGVGEAGARLRLASERYTALAVRLRARVRAAYADVLAARDRAVYYERVLLPLRQRIVDETQLQYNAMQVSPFQLLQAKRDQIAAGNDYIAALRDYWLARVRLDQILSGRVAAGQNSSATPSSTPPARSGEGDH